MQLKWICVLSMFSTMGCQTLKQGVSGEAKNLSVSAQEQGEYANSICEQSATLSPEELAQVQAANQKDPENLENHLKLWGYYRLNSYVPDEKERNSSEAKFSEQEEWLMKNHSSDGIMLSFCNQMSFSDANYSRVKKEWLESVRRQPNNYMLRVSALRFFTNSDMEAAEKFVQESYAYFPVDNYLHEERFLMHDAFITLKQQPAADFKIANLELSYIKAHGVAGEREIIVNAIPKYSYLNGDRELAKKQSEDLLKEAVLKKNGWEFLILVNSQHLLLGQIALDEKNMTEAKKQLLDSVVETPVTSSFGPDLLLAKEILSTGEKNAVVEYLQEYSNICSQHRSHLQKWIQQIKDGKSPDFDKNQPI